MAGWDGIFELASASASACDFSVCDLAAANGRNVCLEFVCVGLLRARLLSLLFEILVLPPLLSVCFIASYVRRGHDQTCHAVAYLLVCCVCRSSISLASLPVVRSLVVIAVGHAGSSDRAKTQTNKKKKREKKKKDSRFTGSACSVHSHGKGGQDNNTTRVLAWSARQGSESQSTQQVFEGQGGEDPEILSTR